MIIKDLINKKRLQFVYAVLLYCIYIVHCTQRSVLCKCNFKRVTCFAKLLNKPLKGIREWLAKNGR